MVEQGSVLITRQPGLEVSSLVVAWAEDAARLGKRVVEHLNKKLSGEAFAEITPWSFFSLNGVTVENDVARMPECVFYACPEKGLTLLLSDIPSRDWYRFLNLVLDAAQEQCRAREVYTVGGMVSLIPHTTPRRLMAVANSPEVKRTLTQYDLMDGFDHETPPGQRPTVSSYLLWAARRRNMPAASLWVPVPFYLAPAEDPAAQLKVLEFLDHIFSLGLDLGDLDREAASYASRIARARESYPDLDEYLGKLESNQTLTQEESERLVKGMEEALRPGG